MLSEVVSEGDSCWFQCLNKRPSQCLKWLSLPFENIAEKAGRERIVDEKENGRMKAFWH